MPKQVRGQPQLPKGEPQEDEDDSDGLSEAASADCGFAVAGSEVWRLARKRKRFRVLLKKLPFKKRICLTMKYSQDLPFMIEGGFP